MGAMHSEYDVESGPAEMKTMPGLVFLVEIMAMMERMLLINMMVVTDLCATFGSKVMSILKLKCVFICVFKSWDCLHEFFHFLQAKGFSPAWESM